MARTERKVVVSGGFDPLHIGHIKLFKEAKRLGRLIVIVNNDNWVKKKKGYVFMPEKEREKIVKSVRYVDETILSRHKFDTDDMSVCNELRAIKPNMFANGGDRKKDDIPEYELCKELGIETIFNIGGKKMQSSNRLVSNVWEKGKNMKVNT